ncbi:hypothetical protein OsI_14615 [Oryza sativa Indica Group]|uniref:Reverse transcriptase zinc-binding domain-containing protein n=1 Tax=Oryza sativa subsp. indica TaxID=39946 RepID=A2XPQ1_ORYSI|nr:hypothetical protein OsI_14615 [Oryza sativa Indica Group]
MPSQLPVKVADLWNNEKERDNLKLNSQFEEEAVQKILQIPLMQDTSSDKLCWRFTKNGECNSKSAYREFYKRDNQNLQQVDSQTLALIKATWKDKNIPPKVKVFAWRFLREALPSSLTLNQRISDIPAACCRCGVTYLSDNTTIADTAKKKNFMDDPGHWSFRPFWTQITSSVPIDRI